MKKNVLLLLMLLMIVLSISLLSSVYGYQESIYEEDLTDETIYSTATLDDNFSDDRVIVVLTRRASRDLREFTTSEFAEMRFSYVRCLTPGMDLVREQFLAKESERDDSYYYDESWSIDLNLFRRTLVLTLAEPSKENVLKAVSLLETREDIMSVSPNLYTLEERTIVNSNSIMNLQPLSSGTDWWQEAIRLQRARNIIANGQRSVTVGVIDTGIDRATPALITSLNHSLSHNFHTTGTWSTNSAHGTAVAGIIAGNQGFGIAPNVQVAALRVYTGVTGQPNDLWRSVQNVMEAIVHATENRIRILNISLDSVKHPNVLSAIMLFPGLVVGSAGNRSSNVEDRYPAVRWHRPRNLILVGATDRTGRNQYIRSNFGNTTVDVFAPGELIRTTGPLDTFRQTSAAAPMVAGVAALMMSANPNLTPCEIVDIIRNTANRNVGQFIRNNSISGGILDAYEAVRAVVPFNPAPNNTINAPVFLPNNRTIINQNPFTVNLVIEYDMSSDGDTIRYLLRQNLLPGHGVTIPDSYFSHWNHGSGFRVWFTGYGRTSGSLWWA